MKNISKLLLIIALLCLTATMAVSCDSLFGDSTTEHIHELTGVAEVKATCTRSGVEAYYTCSGCDKLFADAAGSVEIEAPKAIEKLGHTEETVSGKEATCTDKGLTDGKKCSVCKETLVAQEEIPAKDHSFTNYASDNNATCIADGTKTAKCDRCDVTDTKADEGSALDHSFTSYASDNNATCTADGTKTAKCDRCDETKTVADEGSALDHSFTNYASDNNATCTADGTKTAKCDRCDETNTIADEGSAKGHSPADAVKENIVNATCNTNGSYDSVVYCAVENCKQEISREKVTVEATGEHVYATEQEKVSATCTVDGYVIMACGCGATQKTAFAATGHSYEAAVTAPTCTEAGYTTYTCSVCSNNYTADEVAATGHNYEAVVTAPTCTEAGYTTYTCKNDSNHTYTADEVVATGHTWSGLALATAPTYEAVGAISGTCANCDSTSIEIPAVSAENGYTALITGVVTRWQYTFEDLTFTVDLANADAVTNTYSDDATAWYVGTDESGALIKLDGYKTTDATWDGTNLSFGGSGMTYYTTVTSPKATTVTLILNCARNKAKPFFADSETEHCIDNLTVNSSEDGVICYADAQLTVTGWHNYTDYAIATLFLKEGENTISFITATTVNVKGISFVSTEEIHIHNDVIDAAEDAICTKEGLTQGIHCADCDKVIVAQETIPVSGEHTWSDVYSLAIMPNYISSGKLVKACSACGVYNEETSVTIPVVSEENGYTKVASTDTEDQWQYTYEGQTFDISVTTYFEFTIADNDPFITENGGSFIAGTGDTQKKTSSYGTFYENTKGATFTTTVYVEQATTVTFIIKICSTNNYSFNYADAYTSVTLNGNEVETNEGTVNTVGWYTSTASEVRIATLNLQAGENVITFTAGTETAKSLNIASIAFESDVPVELGAAETEATE